MTNLPKIRTKKESDRKLQNSCRNDQWEDKILKIEDKIVNYDDAAEKLATKR